MDQPIAWHLAHAENCGCRAIDGKLRDEMVRRGIKVPVFREPRLRRTDSLVPRLRAPRWRYCGTVEVNSRRIRKGSGDRWSSLPSLNSRRYQPAAGKSVAPVVTPPSRGAVIQLATTP